MYNFYFISSYTSYTLIFHYLWLFRTHLIYSSYSIKFEIFPSEEKTIQVFTCTSKNICSHFAVCRTVSSFRTAQCLIILMIKYVGLLRMSILQMFRYTDDSLRWKMTKNVFKWEGTFLFWTYFFDVVPYIMEITLIFFDIHNKCNTNTVIYWFKLIIDGGNLKGWLHRRIDTLDIFFL
jgi:hypothetical protein